MRILVAASVGMAALAATLGACGGADRPPTTVTAADTADQTIFGLTHYLTIDGVRRAELQADTAYFYQRLQLADLRGVHVTFYSPQGEETSSLTSRTGTYRWRTGDMEARGNVVATTPDGRRLTTSVLDYTRSTDRISGPVAFVFQAPDRRVEGDAFTSDPDFRDVVATRPKGSVGRIQIERQ